MARLTLYVRDLDPEQLPRIRAVRDRWIDTARPPASALIGVQSLFHPDVRVEVDAIAVIPDRPGPAPVPATEKARSRGPFDGMEAACAAQ